MASFPESFIIDESLGLTGQHDRFRLFFEPARPFVWSGHVSAPGVRMKIVNQIAAADNQDIFGTQQRESSSNLEMKNRWLRFIDAQLNHGNVGLGEHVAEHKPSSVIQCPGSCPVGPALALIVAVPGGPDRDRPL